MEINKIVMLVFISVVLALTITSVRLAKEITDKMKRIIVIVNWDIMTQEIRLIVLPVFTNVLLVLAVHHVVLVKVILGKLLLLIINVTVMWVIMI